MKERTKKKSITVGLLIVFPVVLDHRPTND